MASEWAAPPPAHPRHGEDTSSWNSDSQSGGLCPGVSGVPVPMRPLHRPIQGRRQAGPGPRVGCRATVLSFLTQGHVSTEVPWSWPAWEELLILTGRDVRRGLSLGTPGLLLQAPQPRMGVATERGLSRLEREGVIVSLVRAGRGLAPAPGKKRQKSRGLLLPPPLPSDQPWGPRLGGQVPSPSAPVPLSWRYGKSA